MTIEMLVIVAVIVIPGYFIMKRISRILYSDTNKMDEATERRYGFQRLENELNEKAKQVEENDIQKKQQYHKRARKKIVRLNKKSDSPVIIKYRKQVKNKKINPADISKSDK